MRFNGAQDRLGGRRGIPESMVVVGPVGEENAEEETGRWRRVSAACEGCVGGGDSRQMIRKVAKDIFDDMVGFGGGSRGSRGDGPMGQEKRREIWNGQQCAVELRDYYTHSAESDTAEPRSGKRQSVQRRGGSGVESWRAVGDG